MLTPFFGLSIFIHICVIIICRLFAHIPLPKFKIKQKKSKKCFFSGSFIMISISFIVFMNASSFIYISLTDEYASTKLLQEFGYKLEERLHPNININQPAFVITSSSTNYVSLVGCFREVENRLKKYNGSVAEYLMAQGNDYSFEAQQILAERYQISNYSGNEHQNRALLSNLLLTDVVDTPSNQACAQDYTMVNSRN